MVVSQGTGSTSRAVDEALELAGISADGLIRKREDLPSNAASLHQAILRSFAEQGGPPSLETVNAAAAALGTDAKAALEALASGDLIVRDQATGEIKGAYPFSGKPTRHRVQVHDGRPVYAMCAVDALGIPFMLDRDAQITSEDPVTGQQIRVEVRRGQARWDPSGAVLFFGSQGGEGPLAQTCCSVTNFFPSTEAVEEYQRTHPEVGGRVLSQAEAVQAAQRLFGNLLINSDQPAPDCAC
uniref:alkylmercury lyase family protein n=1 Tax=Pseudomonas sp. K-62 TaxID=76885 RepID=UPI00159ED151|nr:alkylmercury lyase family protein [Pseudomonas sp. K-62]